MAKQSSFDFTDEAYPEGAFVQLHEDFKGSCRMLRSQFTDTADVFTINLTTGECSCKWGQAFVWYVPDEKWIKNKYCVHKLKALADICKRTDNLDLLWPYIKALGTRYNRFEVVSAFHKELRRGDHDQAWYWGCILMTQRAARGVIRYMLAIVYEETRDHELCRWLLARLLSSEVTMQDMARGIDWFCKTKKKWKLKGRYEIFTDEMRAYSKLVEKYGKDVAQPRDIIDAGEYDYLMTLLGTGVSHKDQVQANRGLKGLQKITPRKGDDLQDVRLAALRLILDAAKDSARLKKLFDFFIYKYQHNELGYHDINAFLDAAMGESLIYGVLPLGERKVLLRRPKLPVFAYGKMPQIPLYAHDNHTWKGKGLIRRYPHQLQPRAKQIDMDFRWCGAYFGVAWRMLANEQLPKEEAEWHNVNWPKWLHKAVSDLWY